MSMQCSPCLSKCKVTKWHCICGIPWTKCGGHFVEGLKCRKEMGEPKVPRDKECGGCSRGKKPRNIGKLGDSMLAKPAFNRVMRLMKGTGDSSFWHRIRKTNFGHTIRARKARHICNTVARGPGGYAQQPKHNMFAGSRVLADLMRRGLIKQDQLDDRISHLNNTDTGRKRPSASINQSDQSDHRNKQYKSKPFCDAQGTHSPRTGHLPYRKRKYGDFECFVEQDEL